MTQINSSQDGFLYSKEIIGPEEIKWVKIDIEKDFKEEERIDYEIVLEFGDGFKFVKLVSEKAFEREEMIMHNGVLGYYDPDNANYYQGYASLNVIYLYSLRDKNNKPYLTIALKLEDWFKILGGKILENKMLEYCLKFLEEVYGTIGEYEMKDLGYLKLDNIGKRLDVDEKYIFKHNGEEYISINNVDKIKFNYNLNGNLEQHPGIKILDAKINSSLNIELDLNNIEKDIKSAFEENIKLNLGKWLNVGDTKKFGGKDNEQLTGFNNSKLIGGDRSQIAGWNNSVIIGGNNSQLAGSTYNKIIGGNECQITGDEFSKISGKKDCNIVGGYQIWAVGDTGSKIIGGMLSKIVGKGKNDIIGNGDSKILGISNNNVIGGYKGWVSGKTDNKIIGEDSFISFGENKNQLIGGEHFITFGENENQVISGDTSLITGKENNRIISGKGSKINCGKGSYVIGGDKSEIVLNGTNSLAIGGAGSRLKGKKGDFIGLVEKDDTGEILDIKLIKIDGIEYKEDVFYRLSNGEIVSY